MAEQSVDQQRQTLEAMLTQAAKIATETRIAARVADCQVEILLEELEKCPSSSPLERGR